MTRLNNNGTRIWTDADDRQLERLLASGLKVFTIAAEIGRTENAVYCRMRTIGVRTSGAVAERKPVVTLTPEQRLLALDDLARGLPQSAVADKYRVHPSTISQLAARHGKSGEPPARLNRVSADALAELSAALLDAAHGDRGVIMRDVAARHGIALSTLYDAYNKRDKARKPRSLIGKDEAWALWTRANEAITRRVATGACR